MSIESWEAEFLPIPASSKSLDTDEKRIDHAVKKWSGLTPKNLSAHVLTWRETSMLRTGEDCALCEAHYNEDRGEEYDGACGPCPLYAIGKACGRRQSPYKLSLEHENPTSIIRALLEAKQYIIKKKEKANAV